MDERAAVRITRAVRRLACAGVLVLATSCTAGSPGTPRSAPSGTPGATSGLDRHVAPEASGRADGSSWEDAASLDELDGLIASLEPGGRVLLRADAGPYRLSEPISIHSGGQDDDPVVVQGVTGDGQPAQAVVVGSRSSPYDLEGEKGGEVFRLGEGADHLEFRDLACQDQGTCFRVHEDIEDLVLEDVAATNVRRFFESNGGDDGTATVSGLTVRRVDVAGFSKGAFRLRDDTHDVLLEDVSGDSERQDGDDFAMGVFLGDSVHDVLLRRVTMRNSQDSGPDDDYWNGDGFVTERDVARVRFEDTEATGSTDGGYDIKSSETVLVRALARDNKRNFRIWASDTRLTQCRGQDPRVRGGTGAAAQVWLAEDAAARIEGCDFDSPGTGATVFELEEGAELVVEGGTVRRQAGAELSSLGEGASLVVEAEVEEA